ncbi:MAG: MATE family efflux transporter [Sediminibacterium sp.]|nr:MATE family efflux transporter [Sediminibacterium sp.]
MSNSLKHNLKVTVNYQQIIKHILPLSFSLLIPQINVLVNNIFLSYLGETALAIGGITAIYYLIFALLGLGLNNGLQNLMSKAAGQNNRRLIGILLNQAIILTLFISIVTILITYFITPIIFNTFLPQAISIPSIEFIKIRVWGVPLLYIYQFRNSVFITLNKTKLLFWGTFAETVINILFDYGFIFGNFGLPRLGVSGAAVASILAEFVGLIIIMIIAKKFQVNKTIQFKLHLKISKKYLKEIMINAYPLMLQLLISIISFEFFYIMIAQLGVEALAISNLMRIVFGLVGCFCWAAGQTTNSMISNIMGQNKQYQIIGFLKKIIFIVTIGSIIIIGLMVLFRYQILEIFSNDTLFINHANPVFIVVVIAVFFMCFGSIAINTLIGMGNSKFVLYAEIVTILCYIFYVFYIVHYLRLGLVWAWTVEYVYWILIIIICRYKIMNNLRKILKRA